MQFVETAGESSCPPLTPHSPKGTFIHSFTHQIASLILWCAGHTTQACPGFCEDLCAVLDYFFFIATGGSLSCFVT